MMFTYRRLSLFALSGLLLVVGAGFCVAAGCDDSSSDPKPPPGSDAGPPDGAAGADATDPIDGAGGNGGNGGTGPEGGGCPRTGNLGDPCDDDCGCQPATPCLGVPGKKQCSVPCTNENECTSPPLNCDGQKFCDLSVGACRCFCTDAGCPTGHCLGAYCVGCSTDKDCSGHSCPTDAGFNQPVCRFDTETCVCGGVCGDGVCDEKEAALHSCPADCTGPCQSGAVLPFACSDGSLVDWCVCEGSQWNCVDPIANCPGDTQCQKLGGNCVDIPGNCYGGIISAEAHGCSGQTPLCCRQMSFATDCQEVGGECVAGEKDCTAGGYALQPLGCQGATPVCCVPHPCVSAGSSHPPGEGLCCAGLRSISSLAPMPGYPADAGLWCEFGCWQLTCAPCGDDTCELHFGENPCNCPQDCPHVPYPLACDPDAGAWAAHCGWSFCQQDGPSCHQEIPTCSNKQCVWEIQDLVGHICDPTSDGGLCVPASP